MSIVFVTRDPETISDEVLMGFAAAIPAIIGQRFLPLGLSRLASDVSVRFSDFGPFDVKKFPLEIVIFAGDCSRINQKEMNELARLIAKDLHESTVDGLSHLFISVKSTKGGFFESP